MNRRILYEIRVHDWFQPPSRSVAVYWSNDPNPIRDPDTGNLITPDGAHWDHWRYSVRVIAATFPPESQGPRSAQA